MHLKYRRQRPIKGGREALPSCVLKDIKDAVEREAMKYGVSKSFVIAVRLAKSYKIDEQEDYKRKPRAWEKE